MTTQKDTTAPSAKGYLEELGLILARVKRPKKAVITAGMPYANGPLHLGHLAGAHVPADIHARWMRLLIGKKNVLFVCGTDDHGSTSEVSALKEGKPIQEFIGAVREKQKRTLERYNVSLDIYSGTSHSENFDRHKKFCQDFLEKLDRNKMLYLKSTEQWFDPSLSLFLPDRYVTGTCPKCANTKAYSDECDSCGATYLPSELIAAKSALSDATPVLKETKHWWLDMWKVSDELINWIESKQKTMPKSVFTEVTGTVYPTLSFSNTHEPIFKELRESLPKHKSRYAPGKQVLVQLENLADFETTKELLTSKGIPCQVVDGWAHRSISRDVKWGIPLPASAHKDLTGKTFYVWPESLIAPISFTQGALVNRGESPEVWESYWSDPESKVYQFIGQDNVYFYILMQGAMWLGSQKEIHRQPIAGELQMTDVFSRYHLHVNGEKMSKSKGNFFSGDQLIEEFGQTPDQVRYFLALLSLTEKSSNFDFENLKQRNKFLAGPLNAAFEKPLSAAHSKFDGVVPMGKLIGKTEKETLKMIQTYYKAMEKADYSQMLFMIENYARLINGLFSQYKPHDDRFDEEQRKDTLYSCFSILKTLMIMLSPFVPETMERLRLSLNLGPEVLTVEELGRPIPGGHKLGEKTEYFPSTGDQEEE